MVTATPRPAVTRAAMTGAGGSVKSPEPVQVAAGAALLALAGGGGALFVMRRRESGKA
jgi:hypothetical protein